MDYKKILEGVVDIINTAEKSDIGFANICTYIGENCPELAESEDEKVRKELIELVKQSSEILEKNNQNRMIAWLEKQGEQKPADLEKFIIELSKQFPNVPFGKLSRIAVRVAKWAKPTDEEMKELLRTEYEKGRADTIAEMQKSTWSEKDEKMCQETIDWFEKKCFPYALEDENPAKESISWLKSLKDRYTWKQDEKLSKS